MADFLYIALALAFFWVSIAYVKGCQKLMGDSNE